MQGNHRAQRRILKHFILYLTIASAAGALCVLIAVFPGCSPAYYPYRAISNDCNCEEYSVRDGAIEYLFHARYKMDDGIATEIDITFINGTGEVLSLDLGAARVTSSNVAYQYNDKFLPLPILQIGSHGSDSIRLLGKDLSEHNDWLKIAGERLTVTLKGIRLGSHELPPQTVTFIPQNPKLEQK